VIMGRQPCPLSLSAAEGSHGCAPHSASVQAANAMGAPATAVAGPVPRAAAPPRNDGDLQERGTAPLAVLALTVPQPVQDQESVVAAGAEEPASGLRPGGGGGGVNEQPLVRPRVGAGKRLPPLGRHRCSIEGCAASFTSVYWDDEERWQGRPLMRSVNQRNEVIEGSSWQGWRTSLHLPEQPWEPLAPLCPGIRIRERMLDPRAVHLALYHPERFYKDGKLRWDEAAALEPVIFSHLAW
jgi:hypothetical protein